MANENVLNVLLAEILQESGLDATALKNNSRSQTDIEVKIGDHTIALEAEHGETNAKKKEAIKDADVKLARQVCDLAIALVYPENCANRADLKSARIQAHIRVPGKQPKPEQAEWSALPTTALANFVRQSPHELGSPEALAKKADAAVQKAAAKFTPKQAQSIMAEMGPAAQGTNVKGLMTDLLTALMFHAKLDEIRHQAKPTLDARRNPPIFYQEEWPPASVAECRQSEQIAAQLHHAHDRWLAVDYKQILEWSCAVLHAMPHAPASNEAVEILAATALELQRSAGNQHHDLIGITFCQSVETAKSDGSMYTTIPAATLLTALLFEGLKIDWTNYAQVTALRIVDFACGTGTLLIAAANYILAHEKTGRSTEVAQALLEQILYGFDINNRAIFQTATGLGMIAPGIPFRNMHLYSLLLGLTPEAEGRKAKIGSLELLAGLSQLSLTPRPVTGARIDAEPAPLAVEKFSMAIMNPPFTRGDLRFKQLPAADQKKLRAQEAQLYAGLPMEQSSTANAFFVLAEQYLDQEKGRLAFVVPTVTATNPSAAATRRWLAERFHIKYLVVSYDPQRIFQSGNTDIGEMLVILERKGTKPPPPTTVIKLTANPASASAATACASSLLNGQAEAEQWGTVDSIDSETIRQGNWNAVQFVSNELHRIATQELWDSSLRNQVILGPQGSMIRAGAERCNPEEIGAVPALYNHNTEHCTRLEVKPDCHVRPKTGKPAAANPLRRANHLKLPERARLNTVKTLACRTTTPTVGSAWIGAVPAVYAPGADAAAMEKAIILILNSSPGKLGMLLMRSNKSPSYPNFSTDGIKRIPLPWLPALKTEQVQGLVAAYNELRDQERKPFPQAHLCPVQQKIDAAVCRHLPFDATLCAEIRHLLAQEPMVTGKKYQFPKSQQSLPNWKT